MPLMLSRLSTVAIATLVVAGVAQGGIISEIDPFVGNLTETWESFPNYNDNLASAQKAPTDNTATARTIDRIRFI